MFSLSISASVILDARGQSHTRNSASASEAHHHGQSDTSLLTLSVVPSRRQRWSIDLLGVAAGDPAAQTFDIRVGWSGGDYSEMLGIPLDAQDTLVVDRSGELDVYGVRDERLLPVSFHDEHDTALGPI
jgi:hypothetical protein